MIERITGMTLRPAQEIRLLGKDPKQFAKGQIRMELQEAAREWWSKFEAKGERQLLVDEVSAGGESVHSLASVLVENHPEAAPAALRSGLKNASEEWNHRQLVWTVGNANFEGSEALLRETVEESRCTGPDTEAD